MTATPPDYQPGFALAMFFLHVRDFFQFTGSGGRLGGSVGAIGVVWVSGFGGEWVRRPNRGEGGALGAGWRPLSPGKRIAE